VLAVPLADLVSVILIRRRLGQAVWVGDNNHFSHRLVRRGHTKPRAVLILLLIAAAIGTATFLK
jgi:UDP-GlcNAc:undecaprenyl-phosphate GlcNAc-1-phosphate transferase